MRSASLPAGADGGGDGVSALGGLSPAAAAAGGLPVVAASSAAVRASALPRTPALPMAVAVDAAT